MRIVLDANVVASGVFWSGPPHQILRRCLLGKETLLVSAPILAEYREVLKRLAGASGADIFRKWDVLLAETGEMVVPQSVGRVCRDPDDEKYLEAAVGGRANAVISGDKDILVLKDIRGIPILSPRAFLSQ